MKIGNPVLYIFGISHYCEKARWSLDYNDINYDIVYLPPGLHVQTAKKLGTTSTTLPILVADGQVIQGSDKILDWTQYKLSDESKRLTSKDHNDKYQEIEKRLDEITGVHIRRYYYSEALVEYPETVRTLFIKNLTFLNKLILYGTWNFVRKSMINLMDLGIDQGKESREIVDRELSWIDNLLSDGRHYLVGNKFSRADISAASLLSPLAIPKEHPTYSNVKIPPRMASDLESWTDRPSIQWVQEIYSQYR